MGNLNKQQLEASLPDKGVSLVIAGAGTGKTTTMIEKIKNVLIHSDLAPENLLILTFSRKAAEEIKTRLGRNSGTDITPVFSGTFHSFALQLLREYPSIYIKHFRFPAFPGIITDEDKKEIIRNIILSRKELYLGIPCDTVFNLAENLHRLKPELLKKLEHSGLFNLIQEIPEKYKDYKTLKALIDFDDMIAHASLLLKEVPEIRDSVRSRYRHIFVDEFQDTSDDNFELLSLLLCSEKPNLFMVGDDYQSIYGFRNAKVEYIINIKKYFPEAKILELTFNYRSGKKIIKLSNSFIRQNRFRTSKKIIPCKDQRGIVKFHSVAKGGSETGAINKIISEVSETRNIAVIYRNNYQEMILRRELAATTSRKLQFLTMHGSKGLEFDIVIITGISDRIIPDRTSDIEEERRLFYVAMTRAENELHLIFHKNSSGKLPRFIKELGYRE